MFITSTSTGVSSSASEVGSVGPLTRRPSRSDLQRRLEQGQSQQDVVTLSFKLSSPRLQGMLCDDGAADAASGGGQNSEAAPALSAQPKAALLRPLVEAALRKAVAAEAGSGALAEHVAIKFSCLADSDLSSVEPAAARSGRELNRNTGDAGASFAAFGAKSPGFVGKPASLAEKFEAALRQSANEEGQSEESAPLEAYHDASAGVLASCVLVVPSGVSAGSAAIAINAQVSALSPEGRPMLAERAVRELAGAAAAAATGAAAREAVRLKAINILEVSDAEVRRSTLPELRLDRRHGIPSKVFALFDELQALDDICEVEGFSTSGHLHGGPLDGEEIEWSLYKIAEVFKDPALERLFFVVASSLLKSDRKSCHRWCASIPTGSMRTILKDNPAKRDICERCSAVSEQQTHIAGYLADCKLCVALATVGGDVLRRWNDELAPEDRTFLADCASRMPTSSATRARALFDRVASRFVVVEALIRGPPSGHQPVELAMQHLRQTPKDILASIFKAPWREGPSKEVSFFHLYPAFASRKESSGSSLDEFVDLLARAFGSLPSMDLSGALKLFLEDGSVSATHRRDLFVGFVSACRCPRSPSESDSSSSRRRRRCWATLFEGWGSSGGGGGAKVGGKRRRLSEVEEPCVYPSTDGLELVALEVAVGEFCSLDAASPGLPWQRKYSPSGAGSSPSPRPTWQSTGGPGTSPGVSESYSDIVADRSDQAELLEAVLLVSTGDSLGKWSQEKLANDPRMADGARRLLNGVAWRHFSSVLRTASASLKSAPYDEARFLEITNGERPWAYIGSKACRVFSEHARVLTKRPAEEFGKLLWMYFKLDFALDAGSLWCFMQTLEEGSECLALRFNRLAPPGSALRMRVGEELQKAAGENKLELGEYDHLLRYLGFFNPSVQAFVRRGRALAASRLRFRNAAGACTPAACPSERLPTVPSSPSSSTASTARLIGANTGGVGSGGGLNRGTKPRRASIRGSSGDIFIGLLEATVRLVSLSGVPGDFSTEEAILAITDLCGGHWVQQRLFNRVVATIRGLDRRRSVGFGLRELVACAKELGKSGQFLGHKIERKGASTSLLDGTCSAVDALLKRTAPVEWSSELKGLDTIIFALEYMEKEDLELAYAHFDAEIRSQQSQQLEELLECTKSIYRLPLGGSNPGSLSPQQDIREAIMQNAPPLPRRIVWQGAAFDPADWTRVLEIAAAAAETMRERYSVLMLPHHTQMITLVMFAIRTCGIRTLGVGGRKLPKTMLARVGTGEGKSIIISMLAAFAAKRGLRAHVINDNRALAERDFHASKQLFEKLGVTVSQAREDLTNTDCQVVYCTGDDVEKSCLESLTEGRMDQYEESLRNAILIVDEVDSLIFDKGAVSHESFEDREFSEWANEWLRQLDLKGEIERDWEDFRSHGECSLTIQREVEDAYQQIGLKREGVDYVERGDQIYALDPKTHLIREEVWTLWLDVLRRHRRDGSFHVRYKYIKAVLCRLQCFLSYSCVFGLTGSLGQASEKAYLKEHYEAVTFNVPFFLDTCRISLDPVSTPLAVGDRVVVNVENGDGLVELDRLGTLGLIGHIVEEHLVDNSFKVKLGDGRALWYQESWIARGRFQNRRPPTLVGSDEPLPNRDAQERAVVELAVAKCADVPVLIVVRDTESVRRISAALRQKLQELEMWHGLAAGVESEEGGVIELLHNPRLPQEFVRLVELATEPLPLLATVEIQTHAPAYPSEVEQEPHTPTMASLGADAASPVQRWRIAITTAEGGRGHDYRVVDPSIDERGGLMLILTWVPWSEREWVQFLGRTGRQDHVGQYAVLLDAQEPSVAAALDDRGRAAADDDDKSLARAILRRGDEETAVTMRGKREEIEKGRVMHKLTSRFWTLHKLERTNKKQDWEWKKLCETYLGFNAEAIQQAFCSDIIPPKELVLGFAKLNPDAPPRPGLAEVKCRGCGTVNMFPAPGTGQPMPTVRCGHCNATSE